MMLGDALLHYRIDARLGAGAMGVVYRAYDTRLERTVAIKQLQDALSELSTARILEEARAASALNHPNIATIYDVVVVDGRAVIVMEYVDGIPLSQLIPAGGLAPSVVIDYGRQIADAVSAAHERGVVHRDIKSSNIVLTGSGRPKVLDFGLARRLPVNASGQVEASAQPTTLGVAGTPAYMSPEALRGEAAAPRVDVWSLGIVLYEMATGHRPYEDGTPFQLAAAVLSQSPVVVPAQRAAAAGRGHHAVSEQAPRPEISSRGRSARRPLRPANGGRPRFPLPTLGAPRGGSHVPWRSLAWSHWPCPWCWPSSVYVTRWGAWSRTRPSHSPSGTGSSWRMSTIRRVIRSSTGP